MALTDKSDLFGSVHEAGFNNLVRQIMRQRPSLFNYATAQIAQSLNTPNSLLCAPIEAAKAVTDRNNPRVTVESPLPIPGLKGLGLNYCAQLTRFELDFHPGSTIPMPPELGQLQPQRFGARVSVAAGIGWPANFDSLPPAPAQGTTALPVSRMHCFTLDMTLTGHFVLAGTAPDQKVTGKVDGFELIDIKPDGLESNIELMVKLLLEAVVLPKASLATKTLVLEIASMPGIQFLPAQRAQPPLAVEGDRLKLFLDLGV